MESNIGLEETRKFSFLKTQCVRWGTDWGENGYFRIVQGVNSVFTFTEILIIQCGIETEAYGLQPELLNTCSNNCQGFDIQFYFSRKEIPTTHALEDIVLIVSHLLSLAKVNNCLLYSTIYSLNYITIFFYLIITKCHQESLIYGHKFGNKCFQMNYSFIP